MKMRTNWRWRSRVRTKSKQTKMRAASSEVGGPTMRNIDQGVVVHLLRRQMLTVLRQLLQYVSSPGVSPP